MLCAFYQNLSSGTRPIFSVQYHKYSGPTSNAGLEYSAMLSVSKIVSVTRRATMDKLFLDIAIPFEKGEGIKYLIVALFYTICLY